MASLTLWSQLRLCSDNTWTYVVMTADAVQRRASVYFGDAVQRRALETFTGNTAGSTSTSTRRELTTVEVDVDVDVASLDMDMAIVGDAAGSTT